MKRQNTLLLFLLFSLLPFPFIFGIFNELGTSIGPLWDAISGIIVFLGSVLLYISTFSSTTKCSKYFFIYKLTWLQEMFIILGFFGTVIGFVLSITSMNIPLPPGVDPTAVTVSNLAISMITMVYGFLGALIIYLVQKFYEMGHDYIDTEEVEKPKEGFVLSSVICFLLFIVFICFCIYRGALMSGGISVLLSVESFLCIISVFITLILFYKGNSFLNLMKNIFWYVPDIENNIVYNLKFIRNMKKITAMFICVSLLCTPIIMLAILSVPPEFDNVGWNSLPFLGLKNGGVIFMWILEIIVILTIIEGREVSKLYFETGKVSTGDRFYVLKYIIPPAFLLFFTFSFGILINILQNNY